MAFRQTRLVIWPAQELIFNFVGDVKTLEVYVTGSIDESASIEEKKSDSWTKTLYLSKEDIISFNEELESFIQWEYNQNRTIKLYSDAEQRFDFIYQNEDSLDIAIYGWSFTQYYVTDIYLSVETAWYLKSELKYWSNKMV